MNDDTMKNVKEFCQPEVVYILNYIKIKLAIKDPDISILDAIDLAIKELKNASFPKTVVHREFAERFPEVFSFDDKKLEEQNG